MVSKVNRDIERSVNERSLQQQKYRIDDKKKEQHNITVKNAEALTKRRR